MIVESFLIVKGGTAIARWLGEVDKVSSTGNISQDDGEIIEKIIEEGRRRKVKKMEIEISRDVAMGLNLNGIEGIDVTFGIKSKTKYVMKIEYKYDN